MGTPRHPENVTDKTLRAWLRAAPIDRGIGGGLTFVASTAAAAKGAASWILRYRFGGVAKEIVLGRYPELTLAQARERTRQERAVIQRGEDPAVLKRLSRRAARAWPHATPTSDPGITDEEIDPELVTDPQRQTGRLLCLMWFNRYIKPKYKDPESVEQRLRLHIFPVIGELPARQIKSFHIESVLLRALKKGQRSTANVALWTLSRVFSYGIRKGWVDASPVAGFTRADAGGRANHRERWLALHELIILGKAMRTTASFGRINELTVWLLLALCVRKMELLKAQWEEFDFTRGVWTLAETRTKTKAPIEIPLTAQVMAWLEEVRVMALGSPYVFPRRCKHRRKTKPKQEAPAGHVSKATLNVALMRLPLPELEHFTPHDMRRTARTHMEAMGVSHFVAERALNHKLVNIEGVYNLHDYFDERDQALEQWCALLESIRLGELDNTPLASAPSPRISRAAVARMQEQG
ncbi:tyrosine-type recombinase/integrase [Stenotrophomonas geniculata]